MDYPNITPVSFERDADTHALPVFRAAAIITGGSALVWALIVYAVWQAI
jgi:hypothetical protein